MEDFTDLTPLSVGSPQEVIDKTLTFREHFGDYQRQLFLMDHAGLPLKTVLDQLDLLGEEVVPVLRKELAAQRDPEAADAPTHARPGPGQVRRPGPAPAASEREPRRQRHRLGPLPGHRAGIPGRVPGPVMPGSRHLGNDAWEALLSAHATLMKQFAAEDIWGDISMREYDVLYTLSKCREPVRLSELNRHVLLSQPALSRLVDRLADRGLVQRRPDPADRRGVLLSLTRPAGCCSARSAASTPAASPGPWRPD